MKYILPIGDIKAKVSALLMLKFISQFMKIPIMNALKKHRNIPMY